MIRSKVKSSGEAERITDPAKKSAEEINGRPPSLWVFLHNLVSARVSRAQESISPLGIRSGSRGSIIIAPQLTRARTDSQ